MLMPYNASAYTRRVRLVVRLTGFDWDEANWRKSELKHGIASVEAEEALLNDPICQVDTRHSDDEQRYVALGETNDRRRLFISFTVRRGRARVVSARPMSRKERAVYEEAKKADRR
jgi:uncharacterized protein